MANSLVECYAGRHYPQRPKALWWEGERLEVEETERHWRSQGVRYSDPVLYHYMVKTEHGRFHLVYDTAQGEWQATKARTEDYGVRTEASEEQEARSEEDFC